jgi:hypothetical protein
MGIFKGIQFIGKTSDNGSETWVSHNRNKDEWKCQKENCAYKTLRLIKGPMSGYQNLLIYPCKIATVGVGFPVLLIVNFH